MLYFLCNLPGTSRKVVRESAYSEEYSLDILKLPLCIVIYIYRISRFLYVCETQILKINDNYLNA